MRPASDTLYAKFYRYINIYPRFDQDSVPRFQSDRELTRFLTQSGISYVPRSVLARPILSGVQPKLFLNNARPPPSFIKTCYTNEPQIDEHIERMPKLVQWKQGFQLILILAVGWE